MQKYDTLCDDEQRQKFSYCFAHACMCACMLVYLICNACALVCRFLACFQENKGKDKDALKFVKTFSMKVKNTETVQLSQNAKWCSIGTILECEGIKGGFQDYDNFEEALAAVRHLCAINRETHRYDEQPEQLDATHPEFSRFWYVIQGAKTSVVEDLTEKQLKQECDLKDGQTKQVQDMFMEGMGYQDTDTSTVVAIKSAKSIELDKALELIK